MGDLIDRDRLRERLFPGLLELSRGTSKTAIALYKQGWNDAITSIIQNEPSAEPGWIPVTERLPEEDGMYLISHQNGKVFLDKWLGYDGWENFISVKAWMPLPEAYQPGVSE